MRSRLVVLFVAFYVVTSISGTQFRTRRVVRRVSVATQDQRTPFSIASPEPVDSYPRFREAKKAGMQIDLRPWPQINFSPGFSELEFQPTPTSTRRMLFEQKPSGRGPPLRL